MKTVRVSALFLGLLAIGFAVDAIKYAVLAQWFSVASASLMSLILICMATSNGDAA